MYYNDNCFETYATTFLDSKILDIIGWNCPYPVVQISVQNPKTILASNDEETWTMIADKGKFVGKYKREWANKHNEGFRREI